MFVQLSKETHLNLALAISVRIERGFGAVQAVVTYPNGRRKIYKGDDAMAIIGALYGPICRICGCTEENCSECIDATGQPCHWVEVDLCSRCEHLTRL